MDTNEMIPKPRTKFLKVKCNGCGNEQIIFSAPASNAKCISCGKELAKSTGSKLDLNAKVLKILS